MISIKKILDTVISSFMIFGAWLYAFFVFQIINRVKIIGRENVPRTTNVLYVSHHLTLIDSFLVGLSVFRLTDIILHPSLIPWNAPDHKNFFDRPLFRWIFGHLKNIPVIRGLREREAMFKQLEQLGTKLKNGTLVLFFAGTRSRDGNVGDCKVGVAEIIYEYKPIVIPILLENIQSIMPIEKGFKFFSLSWFNRGRVIIGKPIQFNGCIEQPRNQARKKIAKMVREAVVELENVEKIKAS